MGNSTTVGLYVVMEYIFWITMEAEFFHKYIQMLAIQAT